MARLDRPGAKAKFAVLTFDDGYRDNYDLLLPELARRRIPALVYLTTGFIDRTAPMWWYGIDALLKTHGAIAFNGEETMISRR
jgi:peptidoglycan/xylan/chitin deacetylase (PgdA/CDA1 family)